MAKVCGVPGCGKPVRARGLCERCYKLALRDEKNDKPTFSELEKKGYARPPQESPLRAALRAKPKAKRSVKSRSK